MNIYEALDKAADLRREADKLNQQADDLEYEWVGVAHEDVLTVRKLVDVIRKVGESR